MLSFHHIKDGQIVHYYTMNDFPTPDLLRCVGYLEEEFVKINKHGGTGNGRMQP